MARMFWCRHADCQQAYESVAGMVPTVCPKCMRTASWTTVIPKAAMDDDSSPSKPYALTTNDQKFLKGIRIAAS